MKPKPDKFKDVGEGAEARQRCGLHKMKKPNEDDAIAAISDILDEIVELRFRKNLKDISLLCVGEFGDILGDQEDEYYDALRRLVEEGKDPALMLDWTFPPTKMRKFVDHLIDRARAKDEIAEETLLSLIEFDFDIGSPVDKSLQGYILERVREASPKRGRGKPKQDNEALDVLLYRATERLIEMNLSKSTSAPNLIVKALGERRYGIGRKVVINAHMRVSKILPIK
jgi:hypothetical protein